MGTLRTDRDPVHPNVHETLYPVPDLPGEDDVASAPDEPVVTTEDRVTRMVMTSGSSFELFTALLAAVLAIVGLTGYQPLYMAAASTIAVGFSLFAQGGTIAARWHEAVRIPGNERIDVMGIGTEILGGFAGIVLGILAFAGVIPQTLLPAAALVLGLSLLLGGPAQPDIAEAAPAASPRRWHVTRSVVRTSSGVMVMGGLAALVLGILASSGLGPAIPLSLVANVCTAAALMLAGGSLFARFARRFA